MATFNAACYLQADRYNARLRATVPGCWVVALDDLLTSQRDNGINQPAEYYGNTRREAIENAVTALKAHGLTGNLKLHA